MEWKPPERNYNLCTIESNQGSEFALLFQEKMSFVREKRQALSDRERRKERMLCSDREYLQLQYKTVSKVKENYFKFQRISTELNT